MYDDGRLWVATQKYERQCSGCRKWFWAWGPARTYCYFCQPLSEAELTRFRAGLESGNGHGNGTGQTRGPALVLTHRTRSVDAIAAGGVSGGGTSRTLGPADLCGAPAGG